MCIAILNIKKTLPKVYLQNSFDNNNQGAGLLYVKNNILTTFKTYSKKDLIKEYYKVRKEIKTPIVLHFRIATSGFSEHNLHPFLVNDKLGFVHNGVIWGLGNKDYSDTYQFNEMLKKLPKNFLRNHVIKEFVANYIGGDKLIFLDDKNEWNIINEKNGHWFDGDWFSNNSYQQLNSFVYAGNKKVYKSKFIDDLWEDIEEEKQPETNEYLMELYGVNNEKDLQDAIQFEGFKTNVEAFDYYYKNY
jgi:hypothetical protein